MKLLQFVAIMVLMAVTAGSAFAQVPGNDACPGAIDITAAFGTSTGTSAALGPYDNTHATHHATDPAYGFGCFGEPDGSGDSATLDNTLWFKFTGNGHLYFIETTQCSPAVNDYINDGDTQIAIYKGSCGGLVPVVCNEDGPGATANNYPAGLSFRPGAGETYYMLVDGFNYLGDISRGKFCISVMRMPEVLCTDPAVSAGNAGSSSPSVCYNQMVTFTATGVSAPNAGSYYGVSWVITSADLMGGFSSLYAPNAVLGAYPISSPAPWTSTFSFFNDGSIINGSSQLPYGTYYWTPIVFGMAMPDSGVTSPFYISDLVLDPACTYIGASVPVAVLPPNDPGCNVTGLEEQLPEILAIENLYPVPARQEVYLQIAAAEAGSLTIRVTDVLGKEIGTQLETVSQGSNQIKIALQNEPAGLYFVSVTNGKARATARFVKQ